MKVFLASKSKRRIKILKSLLRRFTVKVSGINEGAEKGIPSRLVVRLAREKALSVSRKSGPGVFLGFDTIVYFNGKIIGKPGSLSGAKKILKSLSGRWHKVYTGVFIDNRYTGRTASGYEVSRVKFRKLDGGFIDRYSAKHFDKAGAYAVQEGKKSPVEKIKGDYTNVVGFPVKLFLRLARKTGYKL